MCIWINVDAFVKENNKIQAIVEVTNRASINPSARRTIYKNSTGNYVLIHGKKSYFHMPEKLITMYKDSTREYLTVPISKQ